MPPTHRPSPAIDLNIIADEKILMAREAFSTLGKVTTKSGSEINSSDVANADILITRTTTKVTEGLLKDSAIKYVATATAGTDHVDLDYLSAKNIGFTSAPGCNSEAVAEFVVNALIRLAEKKRFKISGLTLGIIGAGNAGRALKKKASCLGLNCLLNDPPLFDKTGDSSYLALPDLVRMSDVISLHVPLSKTGSHPTFHLIDQHILEQIKPGSILINTSRGGVVDETALAHHRDKFKGIILDVWENEPDINFDSLSLADIATQHIAGYSLDGKFKATEIVYNRICSYFRKTPSWLSPRIHNSKPVKILVKDNQMSMNSFLKQTYDIYEDDSRLRKIVSDPDPGKYFSELRGNYKFRNEFSNFKIINPNSLSESLRSSLYCLGFDL